MQHPPSQSSAGPSLGTSTLTPAFPADIPTLRALLGGGVFALLRMPVALEQAFRGHFRRQAADVLRRSIYGLMLLYLSVVVPVAILSAGKPQQAVWLGYAVFPIGMVLLMVWTGTLLRSLARFVEIALGGGVFACLCGTIYCAMLLGNSYFGQVAAYETFYVLVVGFILLRMPTRLMLRSAFLALLVAAAAAVLNRLSPDWLNGFLYFLVPLSICAIGGYMLEYAARRDFVQVLCYRQEKSQLLNEMAAVGNDVDDVHAVLEFALGRICTNMGWISGHASLINPAPGERTAVRYVNHGIDNKWTRHLETELPPTMLSSLLQDVLRTGEAAWNIQSLRFQDVLGDRLASGLAFPVKVDNEIVAVLEFLSVRHEEPDEHLLSLMDQVGQQLSRVFERRRKQQEIKERALYDALTSLPNRVYLFDHLRAALARAQRKPGYGLCVLLLDIDRFKWVNDSLGHLNGDRLLNEFGTRLQQDLRPNDLVARLGSDEFAVLIDDVVSESDAVQAAQRVQQRMQQPMSIAGHEILVGVSIGIAIGTAHYQEPEDLLRDANTALHMAKHSGRGTQVVFAEYMREGTVDRLHLVSELRRAIEGNELTLHYQPIVALECGRVSGFEALVRWRHPQRGLLTPESFIPIAEETGLIVPLTRWVLAEACRQLGEWQQKVAPATPLGVSINFCARYFVEADMPDEVRRLIRENKVRPGSLRLELTETQIIENAELCMRNIHRLEEDKVAVYIDDFGTGYSSLNYLASFKVSALKIDRSFMSGLEGGGKEAIVVRAIISLSQHLGLTVIAEGVETPEQLNRLRELGCHYVQGYLLSRALEPEKAQEMIGRQLVTVHGEQLALA